MSNYMTFEIENQGTNNPRTGQNPGQGQNKPNPQNPNRPADEGEDESETG